jgi:predicted  nucleic acid-binding Zn-ribbon protein
MRLEVQSLRGQGGALEEKVLRLLDDVDPVRDEVAGLNKEIDRLNDEKEGLESSIKEQWKTIDDDLARKEERKVQALAPIDAGLLDLYEKLRGIKEGAITSQGKPSRARTRCRTNPAPEAS